MRKIFCFTILLFLLVVPNKVLAVNEVNVYFFYSEECNICSQEKVFLQALKEKYPNMRVYSYNVGNEEYQRLLNQAKQLFDIKTSGVPFTVIGDTSFLGFSQSKKPSMQNSVYQYSLNSYKNKVGELLGVGYRSDLEGTVEKHEVVGDYIIEESSGKEHTTIHSTSNSTKIKKFQSSIVLVSVGGVLAIFVLMVHLLERRRQV